MEKQVTTSINIGETSGQPFVQSQTVQEVPPIHHHFMSRKFRRGCCCLTFLLLLNLIVVTYIAKKVTKLYHIFSENEELAYMPGGYKPFCSDLCITLCVNNYNNTGDVAVHPTANVQMSQNLCDVISCVDNCVQHLQNNNEVYNENDEDGNDDSSENEIDDTKNKSSDDSSENGDVVYKENGDALTYEGNGDALTYEGDTGIDTQQDSQRGSSPDDNKRPNEANRTPNEANRTPNEANRRPNGH